MPSGILTSKASPLSKMTPPGQIIEVIAMSISLLLKGNGAIGAVEIALNDQTHQPLQHIYYIEPHEEELAHLRRVDSLMVHQLVGEPRRVAHPQRAQQIDTKSLRHKARFDYYGAAHHAFAVSDLSD